MSRYAWLLALLALGCQETGFAEPEQLIGYRVLGIIADPPEVSPDGQVQLRAIEHDTEPDRPVQYTWRICLFSLGDLVNFECIDPALERPLDSDTASVSLDLGPDGLGVRRLFEAFSEARSRNGEAISLEDGFDAYVHLVAAADGGRTVSTYKRVRISEAAQPNRNPSIAGIDVDGAPAAGPLPPGKTVELRVRIDEHTRDQSNGLDEVYTYEWFAQTGTIEDPIGPSGASTDYVTPDDATTDTVIIIVRDGRGGTARHTLDLQFEQGE